MDFMEFYVCSVIPKSIGGQNSYQISIYRKSNWYFYEKYPEVNKLKIYV